MYSKSWDFEDYIRINFWNENTSYSIDIVTTKKSGQKINLFLKVYIGVNRNSSDEDKKRKEDDY